MKDFAKQTQDFKKETAVFGEITEKLMIQNLLLKDALGLSPKQMEDLYSQAYHQYNTGKYADAAKTFLVLSACDQTEPKYIMGAAASLHLQKEYKDAVKAYMTCCMLEPENPIPLYHVADCTIQLKDHPSAMIFLEMAIKRCGDKPEYAEIKKRSELTLERLKKQPSERGQI